jgi:hypothetical protein
LRKKHNLRESGSRAHGSRNNKDEGEPERKLFEVSVSDLLGNPIAEQEEKQDIGEVAKQLAILNDMLKSTFFRHR